jgi:hypothetical protein
VCVRAHTCAYVRVNRLPICFSTENVRQLVLDRGARIYMCVCVRVRVHAERYRESKAKARACNILIILEE